MIQLCIYIHTHSFSCIPLHYGFSRDIDYRSLCSQGSCSSLVLQGDRAALCLRRWQRTHQRPPPAGTSFQVPSAQEKRRGRIQGPLRPSRGRTGRHPSARLPWSLLAVQTRGLRPVLGLLSLPTPTAASPEGPLDGADTGDPEHRRLVWGGRLRASGKS